MYTKYGVCSLCSSAIYFAITPVRLYLFVLICPVTVVSLSGLQARLKMKCGKGSGGVGKSPGLKRSLSGFSGCQKKLS